MKKIIITGTLFFLVVMFFSGSIQDNTNVSQNKEQEFFKPINVRLNKISILEAQLYSEFSATAAYLSKSENISNEDFVEIQVQTRMREKLYDVYIDFIDNYYDFLVEMYKKYEGQEE